VAQQNTPSARRSQFADLLEAAAGGSNKALGVLLESCRHYLLLIAREELRKEVKSKVSPSDLIQQTFLEAQKDFAGFHGESHSELLAWLRRILLNNVANEHRKFLATKMRKVAREVPLQTRFPDPRQPLSPRSLAIAREDQERLKQALGRLAEQDQVVLRLRFEENHSFVEIGRLMNRSEEAARKLWFRAVQRLRREMESAHEPPA
jgi:RNA polymerase sigma-70 factor (ECF subfamily)